jgi:DNA-binding transcriptional LysR family regulator
MDLNRVAAFARVVHDGSFTAAAKALGLPKSSVSRSVAQLEQDLGARLLHRTTRKLHLTDAGSAFYERVARALTDIDEATNVASDTQAQPRGLVRVTAPLDIGVWALAGVVSRFVKKQSTIRVEVSLSNRQVDLVAEGFDLAVRAGPIRDQSLIARRVGTVEAGLYAASHWVKKNGLPTSVSDLSKFDNIVFRPLQGQGTYTLVTGDGRKEEVAVTGRLSADDLSFVKKSALAGAGIGLIPEFLCAREWMSGKLVRVLPEWSLGGGAELSIVYPSARFLPQRVAVVRDFLVAELGAIFRRCDQVKATRAAPSPKR